MGPRAPRLLVSTLNQAPTDPAPVFDADRGSFEEKWVKGLVECWDLGVKDRTPTWASGITTTNERDILATAHEFGTTRPAIALFERGVHAHSNGVLNGMAVHSLNALVGSLFAEGGLMYQMGLSYGSLPVKEGDFMDDYAQPSHRPQDRPAAQPIRRARDQRGGPGHHPCPARGRRPAQRPCDHPGGCP